MNGLPSVAGHTYLKPAEADLWEARVGNAHPKILHEAILLFLIA